MDIAILDDYAGVALDYGDWSGVGDVKVFRDTITDQAALIARLAPFDVICVMRERTPLTARVINALPRLRLIVTTGARNASIDLAAAKQRGITVCGTESRRTTTSELTTALMLAINRRILPESASLHAGGWQSGLGRDLAGLTLGLVGLGTIGGQMARIGQVFGMNVMAWSANLTDARCQEFGGARAGSLIDLMAASDVVSVHIVLSDRSRGLIGAAEFAALPEGAVFINTSRAGIVDTPALLAGLRAGRPWKAGIDVFETEPLPANDPIRDPALIKEGRLLLTPHLGYTTEQTFRIFYGQSAEAVRAWAAGNPIRVIG